MIKYPGAAQSCQEPELSPAAAQPKRYLGGAWDVGFRAAGCLLDVKTPGANEQQRIWQQLQLAPGPAFLLPGMGPGQAAALPGCPLCAGTAARAAGDRRLRCWKDGPVHRGGVAHLQGRCGSGTGATLPGLSLLPQGGPEEYGGLEVRPGPGGAAEGLTAPLPWVQRDPRQPSCVLHSGASHLSERPGRHLQEVCIMSFQNFPLKKKYCTIFFYVCHGFDLKRGNFFIEPD